MYRWSEGMAGEKRERVIDRARKLQQGEREEEGETELQIG